MALEDLDLAASLGQDFYSAGQAPPPPTLPSLYDDGSSISAPSAIDSPSVAPRRIGGLNDILASSDLPGLRSTYQDYLTKALNVPSRAEPDSDSLFWQAGLPMLAAGIFGGSEGLAASAEPVASVFKRELERATIAADNERNQALRTAQLVENRIGDVENSFEKAAALEQRREAQQQNLEFRKTQQESTDAFREQTLALREQMVENQKDKNAGKQERYDEVTETRLGREKDAVDSYIQRETKDVTKRLEGIQQTIDLLSQPNAIADEAARTALVKNLGFDKGAVPEAQARRALPASLKGDITNKVVNYLGGKAETGITPEVRQAALLTLAKIGEEQKGRLNEEYDRIGKKAQTRASLHRKLGRISEIDEHIRWSKPPILDEYNFDSSNDDTEGTQNDLTPEAQAEANAYMSKWK